MQGQTRTSPRSPVDPEKPTSVSPRRKACPRLASRMHGLLLLLALGTPALGQGSFQDIPVTFTFDHDHTDAVSRMPSLAGANRLRGDPGTAASVSYAFGGKIIAMVGRNRWILVDGNNSSKVNAGSTVFLDLTSGLGCPGSTKVDVDDLPGCDPCLDVVPLLPDSRFGSLQGADTAGLPDNFELRIHGEDFDDLAIGCMVETGVRLIFDVGGQQWELWWGPYIGGGGATYNPGSDGFKVIRVSTSEWRFQTTGEHRAALYRRVDASAGRATEYHGQFIVPFSGTAVALTDPGPTPAADEHCDTQLPLGIGPCTPPPAPPTVTILQPAEVSSFTPGSTVTFTASATDYLGNDLSASIQWFLNGQTDPFANGASANVAFPDAGTYTVTAKATDPNGTGSDDVRIMVTAPVPVGVSAINYSLSGNRKNLFVTATVVDGNNLSVSGASFQSICGVTAFSTRIIQAPPGALEP